MENFNLQRDRHNEYLGVNRAGKNIKKSPLHQPSFGNTEGTQLLSQTQNHPQIYNISKNDFRAVVQQLTGSPLREAPPRAPPNNNPPRPQSRRLQRIRPPPLSAVTRPPFHNNSPGILAPGQQQPLFQPATSFNGFFRPPQYRQQAHPPLSDQVWDNTAESPVSAYMRYLMDPQTPQPSSQICPPQSEFLHRPQQPSTGVPQNLHIPSLSSPRPNIPLLPSPISQFPLQSPTSFMNMFSSRSPYPLLSPGLQFPPLPSPNQNFPPHSAQPGILGPAPPLPPSPGSFPQLSPGFFRF